MIDNILDFSTFTAPHSIEEKEAAFIQKNEKFICAVVWNYAALGGNIEANQHLIEDMIQEAKLAVLNKFRKSGNNYDEKILGYTGVIRNACLKVVSESKTIKVPSYWIKRSGRDKGDYTAYECQNIDDVVIPTNSFEDAVVRKMMVDKLMAEMPKNAQTVYILVGNGYTPHQIDKHYGINHRTVRYWLKKGRDFLEKEMEDDGKSRQFVA